MWQEPASRARTSRLRRSRGLLGTPLHGGRQGRVGFWLEGGAVWQVSLLGFKERKTGSG